MRPKPPYKLKLSFIFRSRANAYPDVSHVMEWWLSCDKWQWKFQLTHSAWWPCTLGHTVSMSQLYPANTLEPLLQSWTRFNPSMDKQLHPLYNVGWNNLSIPKLQQCDCWSLEWISNFIPYLIGHEMLEIKLIYDSKRGPGSSSGQRSSHTGS